VHHRSPPNIYFKKKKTGGVSINSTLPLTRMDEKLIQRVLQEYKIHNCEVGREHSWDCLLRMPCMLHMFCA
jgi:ribosome-interacting GTPase 1